MKPSHIHEPDDGRGLRDVYVDGRLVQKAFYADTRRGLVRAYRTPLRLDKYRKRPLWRTLRGAVTIVPREDEEL